MREPVAVVDGRIFTNLIDRTSDLRALDSSGTWVVLLPYSGSPICLRFAKNERWRVPNQHEWRPVVAPDSWSTSLSREPFCDGVRAIRERISCGDVYQVNLTRQLRAPLQTSFDALAFGAALTYKNPAPYAALIDTGDVTVVSATPEAFLKRRARHVSTSPIKGTAANADGFLEKDYAENLMITDLVRNDLGRVCEWGSIEVDSFCAKEFHPGLVHLVSTVTGSLRGDVGWAELIDASFPPGSVTGAPKLAAMRIIDDLEPVARGPYCGAIGWVDADAKIGILGVTIRTFWVDDGDLCFGSGGGITWGSDPTGEWMETELKAATLLAAASKD